jgi:lysylphosphatidylglycerol synthetase-like protein (DUF2156 family)
MLADTHTDKPGRISPDRFLTDLNCAAKYIFEQGLPFFISGHIKFTREYLKAWSEQAGIEAVAQDYYLLDPFLGRVLHPASFLVTGFVHSVASSAWLALSKSIRIVPPLITALVIIYVTGDAWRILGTGFTLRFFCMLTLFLLSSLFILIRFRGYWEKDFNFDESDGAVKDDLLGKIKHDFQKSEEAVQVPANTAGGAGDEWPHDPNEAPAWKQFNALIDLGAEPLPLILPSNRGFRISQYVAYVAVSAFSLIVIALAVSASLIIVGTVLISARETRDLAHATNIYLTLPGHFVITQQLVSLSLTLGAFAVFFLVAGQRTEDRKELMDNALAFIRKVFVVYSVYARAHDHAAAWTGVPVKSPPLAKHT